MKKCFKILISAVLVICLVALTALTVSAIQQDEYKCYLISTPQELVEFASIASSNRSVNAKLTADLDMTDVSYTAPSGYYGHFDGQGHTIKNLTRTVTNAASGNYGLLFDSLGNGYANYVFGEVVDLTLENCSISVSGTAEKIYVGALTGMCDRNDAYDIRFKNVDVTVNGGAGSSAGLVTGLSSWGALRDDNNDIQYMNIVSDSASSVTAIGTNVNAGAVVGIHTAEPIYFHGCETNAAVTAENGNAGGIIGNYSCGNNPKIYNCTVKGSVSGKNAGALVGHCDQTPPEMGVMGLTNSTGLSALVGGYASGSSTIEYYDDVNVYGKAPATKNGDYLISNAEELFWFAKFLNGNNNKLRIRLVSNAYLTADIDMTGKNWEPIKKFRGTLDGQGHTVKGIHINVENAATGEYGILVNLMGNLYNADIFSTVKNLTLADSSITVTGNGVACCVGGIAGKTDRGSYYDVALQNVDVTVNGTMNTDSVVGGITGWAQYGADKGSAFLQNYISCSLDTQCSVTANSTNVKVGGLIGQYGTAECFRILDCTVSAALSGKSYVGGIIGAATSTGNRWFMISDCNFFGTATSDGTGADAVASGVIAYSTKQGHVLDCSVTGIVSGSADSQKYVGKSTVEIGLSGNTDGSLSSGDKTVSLYYQTRTAQNGAHDLRLILVANVEKLKPYQQLDVTVTFYGKDDKVVAGFTNTLSDKEDSDYALFKTVAAHDERLTADDDSAIFGNVVTNIPNGAYSYFTVSVKDGLGNEITSATTKKEESSLAGKTFYFLGSSVTYGSASGGKSFVELIAERNGAICKKEAVSGTTLVTSNANSYVYRMLNTSVFDKNADVDHFIVQLSTNDATNNKPIGTVSDSWDLNDFDTTTIVGAMEYIICYAQTTWNCPVSFYTGTCYNSNLYVQMIAALYQLQEKWGIGIIDMYFDTQMCKVPVATYNAYMSDSIHPNIVGYEKWWTPVFEEHLKSYQYD